MTAIISAPSAAHVSEKKTTTSYKSAATDWMSGLANKVSSFLAIHSLSKPKPSTTSICMPVLVSATSPTNKWCITSHWTDELAQKVSLFLSSHSFEFYTTGKAPSLEAAQKLVKGARDRAEAGVPFTRFPVLDLEGNVLGEFAIGFDDDPKKLQIATRWIKQEQGIGREILDWCFKQYLPALHQKGVRLPVFAEGQENVAWKDKKVAEWKDLKDVTVVALSHPDNQAGCRLLERSEFKKVAETYKESFAGVHDGRRIIYERPAIG